MKQITDELLSCIPHHNSRWKVDQDKNLIVLLRPKFSNRILVRYLLPLMKNQDYRINLDEIGTHVWNHIDGKRTVFEIGQIMKENLGDRVDPVNERLVRFILSLQRYKLILLQKP